MSGKLSLVKRSETLSQQEPKMANYYKIIQECHYVRQTRSKYSTEVRTKKYLKWGLNGPIQNLNCETIKNQTLCSSYFVILPVSAKHSIGNFLFESHKRFQIICLPHGWEKNNHNVQNLESATRMKILNMQKTVKSMPFVNNIRQHSYITLILWQTSHWRRKLSAFIHDYIHRMLPKLLPRHYFSNMKHKHFIVVKIIVYRMNTYPVCFLEGLVQWSD